ncbi:choice-of-anchor J domain-containing protein [Gloeobacter kilaueensis]|uniref:PEP-CTERM protein-sorting domain-containing protein n=1 Tax=Gloeobacter kilaueensis (strain ATCC BAA-2537 / CCAP 1431/1 / ULC 316 / JS1) TaxID=1183438 RepID=U5QD19_GLOK1|nr:choice-of-anchor J domain-containing protein [Gloeobacter kilaueensis]AGY56797.1 hypothetical protein GKIL_0551 [Gloeobacter kilaueensis JS1]
MRRIVLFLSLAALLTIASHPAQAIGVETLSEGFEDVSALPGEGWSLVNQSNPAFDDPTDPLQGWFQGTSDLFTTSDGPSNSYIAADFSSTPGDPFTGVGTVNNYLITPELDISQGGAFSFSTRTFVGAEGNFSLNVLLCTTDCSNTANFNTSLLSLSNNQAQGSFYPGSLASSDAFENFSVDIAAQANGEASRIAFQFTTPEGGTASTTFPAVGIDTVNYVPEPTVGISSGLLLLLGGAALRRRWRPRS